MCAWSLYSKMYISLAHAVRYVCMEPENTHIYSKMNTFCLSSIRFFSMEPENTFLSHHQIFVQMVVKFCLKI